MSLNSLVASGVALASKITASMQVTVTHTRYLGVNGYGEPSYGTAVTRKAFAEFKSMKIINREGREIVCPVKLTFLGDVTVDVRDQITVPGATGDIADFSGLLDPATGRPYATVVYLG